MKKTYQQKRAESGGDSYGVWSGGVQQTPDRVCGRALVYDSRKGTWR